MPFNLFGLPCELMAQFEWTHIVSVFCIKAPFKLFFLRIGLNFNSMDCIIKSFKPKPSADFFFLKGLTDLLLLLFFIVEAQLSLFG